MKEIVVETFRENGKVCVNYVEIDGVKYHPNYRNLVELGFLPWDTSYERGYVSREIDIHEALAFVAGGNRKGQLYIEAPNIQSTRYFIRLYFKAPAPLVFREYQE